MQRTCPRLAGPSSAMGVWPVVYRSTGPDGTEKFCRSFPQLHRPPVLPAAAQAPGPPVHPVPGQLIEHRGYHPVGQGLVTADPPAGHLPDNSVRIHARPAASAHHRPYRVPGLSRSFSLRVAWTAHLTNRGGARSRPSASSRSTSRSI
jgi:hypothetical protein